MKVFILDLLDSVALIEYEDEQHNLQRKYLSRDFLFDSIKRVWVEIPKELSRICIEYSDVDLVENLGMVYNGVPISDLEQAFRRAGLWTRAEYLRHPEKIAFVLHHFQDKIDVATIQNATRRISNE